MTLDKTLVMQLKTLHWKSLMWLAFGIMNFSVNHDVIEKLATSTLLPFCSQIMNKMQSLTNKDNVHLLVESDKFEEERDE